MKVSAYCTVYNHEKYLHTALQGFVNQKTDFKYEVFVHDDASTDNSKKIIEEYAQQYPQIIKPIYQQENQYSKGVNIFTTFILPRMSGEYIAVCEGDDCWTEPLKLQRQADFLDQHLDYVACVHNTTIINMWTHKERLKHSQLEEGDISFADAVYGGGRSYHTSSLMYRIQYATMKMPDYFLIAEKVKVGDYPLAIYLTLSGKVKFLNYNMSLYRLGTENSWSKRIFMNQHENACMHQVMIDMLEEVNRHTNYEHNEILKDEIMRRQFLCLLMEEKYRELRRDPYKSWLNSKSYGYKIKALIRIYFGRAYHCYRRIVYGSKTV